MAINTAGIGTAIKAEPVAIRISAEHPLVKLCNVLDWQALAVPVIEDLKSTTAKGFWWLGRSLYVRIHLAVYLLQVIYDLTDRKAEYAVKDNAAFQLFAGRGIVPKWNPPDHTKIEEFRSRLSPKTKEDLSNTVVQMAVSLGFADPREVDFDSTVQEANIAYPSDASLMTKLCGLGKKVLDYLAEKTRGLIPESLAVDMKAVKEQARRYFFMAKNTAIEKRREVFAELHRLVKKQMRPVVALCGQLDARRIKNMPWNIRRAFDQIDSQARRYLLDVAHFVRNHAMKSGKILAFHAQQVACIIKNKAGKEKEFGRVFQMGRLKGNFLMVAASISVRMEDKKSLVPLMEQHAKLFGESTLESATADKGYWSGKNLRAMNSRSGMKEAGLQAPSNVKNRNGMLSQEAQDRLYDRRAGIEPLIGHVKQGGQLGQSRMKSDTATLGAGYGSVLGFNLRQLTRYVTRKAKVAA